MVAVLCAKRVNKRTQVLILKTLGNVLPVLAVVANNVESVRPLGLVGDDWEQPADVFAEVHDEQHVVVLALLRYLIFHYLRVELDFLGDLDSTPVNVAKASLLSAVVDEFLDLGKEHLALISVQMIIDLVERCVELSILCLVSRDELLVWSETVIRCHADADVRE